MIDPDILRRRPQEAAAALARRGFALDLAAFAELDARRKAAIAEAQEIAARRNALAAEIGAAKKAGSDAAPLLAQGEALREALAAIAPRQDAAERALEDFLSRVPNLPLPAPVVPDGASDQDNVVLRQVGDPRAFDFAPKEHDEIGAALGGLDFEAAAGMSGSRFAVLKGPVARLHRALVQMMLDTHVDENGYAEVQTPYLVRPEALFGTGQLPKFEEDLFRLERDGLYLIPTAEVPVTNLVAGSILREEDLPLAFACHTPCFRREAGSAGRDVKGLIRQHQFEKVELVRVCDPARAEEEFDILLASAESVLQKLGLPYRAVALCAGDMGFSSERTVDLEVWMPGQNAWREISSVSRFGDFQARRMKAKFKGADGKTRHLATLNGSGVAAGRALVAVLENYQRPDLSVEIPEALRPYMNGLAEIRPSAPAARKPKP